MTEMGDKQREDVIRRLVEKGLTRDQAENKIATYLQQKAAPADEPEAKSAPVSQATKVAKGDSKDTQTMSDTDTTTTDDTTTPAAAKAAKPAKEPKEPKAAKEPKEPKAPKAAKVPVVEFYYPLDEARTAKLDAFLAAQPDKQSRSKWVRLLTEAAVDAL